METMTTLYWQWRASGCFYCDFVYVPGTWIPRLNNVTIPGYLKCDKVSEIFATGVTWRGGCEVIE
jgi:hypothetical protein